MPKKRFGVQIASVLKRSEMGAPIAELIRKFRIMEQKYTVTDAETLSHNPLGISACVGSVRLVFPNGVRSL